MTSPTTPCGDPRNHHPQIKGLEIGMMLHVHLPNGCLYSGTLIQLRPSLVILDNDDGRHVLPFKEIMALTFHPKD